MRDSVYKWLKLHLLDCCPVRVIKCQIAKKSLFFFFFLVTVLSVFIEYADESEQK